MPRMALIKSFFRSEFSIKKSQGKLVASDF